jgi:hypothetical protein
LLAVPQADSNTTTTSNREKLCLDNTVVLLLPFQKALFSLAL